MQPKVLNLELVTTIIMCVAQSRDNSTHQQTTRPVVTDNYEEDNEDDDVVKDFERVKAPYFHFVQRRLSWK
jgi:hypothetical protein